MINPQGSYYFAERLLAAPESETLFIPGSDEDLTYDLLILAAGPGKDGSPMQAAPGDRVIVEPRHFWEWVDRNGVVDEDDFGPNGPHSTGFISDADLVAVIPGPDHEEIYPCNDYVLIEPDRLYKQDAGNIVQERPSGLLVASHTLVGGGERAKQEGWQAYVESQRLWDSPEWQQEPDYYRHKRLHAYLNGLPDDVRRECCRFAESEEAPRQKIGWVQREAPTRGRVVSCGPQVYWEGRAVRYWHTPGVSFQAIEAGDVVHWPASHQCLVLQVGDRQLLALKAGMLDAVETE